ncbi:DUF4260 family protein [Rhizobium sp. SG741]|uniref:DUF4260 family protein n=1 Tax=Rhizobium sp. SG741 TaxID=2587114 RepID=UPI001444C9A1
MSFAAPRHLTIDSSIAGPALAGKKVGAALYNAAHWYIPPLALIAWGMAGHAPVALAVGLVWAAHIGLDRALGYGLKYAEGFGMTHLESIRR